MGEGVTEASSVIPEEKPGMPVCHRAKYASGPDRGSVSVEPKRPCRLPKLGDTRITKQCQRKLQRHPKRCEHVDCSQQSHKGFTSQALQSSHHECLHTQCLLSCGFYCLWSIPLFPTYGMGTLNLLHGVSL